MEYCRFSSDGFRCDVFAYGDVSGGWTIHVAARKRDIPADFSDPLQKLMEPLDPEKTADVEARVQDDNLAYARLENFPCIELTCPSAGKTFNEPSLRCFRDRMVALRSEGLRFPDEVFAIIDEEIGHRDRSIRDLPTE